MRKRKLLIVIGVGAVVASTLPLLPVTPALAKCQPYYNGQPRTDDGYGYFGGAQRLTSDTGVESTILEYDAYVAPNGPGENHGVSAWVMLDDPTTIGGTGMYGQVGWLEYPDETRTVFAQTKYQSGGGTINNFYSAQPVGNSTGYRAVAYQAYGGGVDIEYSVNGYVFDLESVASWPSRQQVTGETNTLASQMPGGYGSGSQEVFSGSYILSGGYWLAMGGTAGVSSNGPNNPPTQYMGASTSSSTQYLIWDKACAS